MRNAKCVFGASFVAAGSVFAQATDGAVHVDVYAIDGVVQDASTFDVVDADPFLVERGSTITFEVDVFIEAFNPSDQDVVIFTTLFALAGVDVSGVVSNVQELGAEFQGGGEVFSADGLDNAIGLQAFQTDVFNPSTDVGSRIGLFRFDFTVGLDAEEGEQFAYDSITTSPTGFGDPEVGGFNPDGSTTSAQRPVYSLSNADITGDTVEVFLEAVLGPSIAAFDFVDRVKDGTSFELDFAFDVDDLVGGETVQIVIDGQTFVLDAAEVAAGQATVNVVLPPAGQPATTVQLQVLGADGSLVASADAAGDPVPTPGVVALVAVAGLSATRRRRH